MGPSRNWLAVPATGEPGGRKVGGYGGTVESLWIIHQFGDAPTAPAADADEQPDVPKLRVCFGEA